MNRNKSFTELELDAMSKRSKAETLPSPQVSGTVVMELGRAFLIRGKSC
jgi:type II secretory pathway component HofQ